MNARPVIQAPPPAPPGTDAVVLPRPNLGPEPWSEPAGDLTPAVILLVAALGLMALVGLAILVRRGRARRPTDPATLLARRLSEEPSATRRLLDSSLAVRAALIAAFGPTWGSRTTEEIARDPAIADRLAAEVAGQLVAFLQRVDRVKFAGDEPGDLDAWVDVARALLGHLRAVPIPPPPRSVRTAPHPPASRTPTTAVG